MNISKFGLGLSLAAAVGLVACGDDSSSFSPASHDDPDTTLSSSSETSGTPDSSDDNGTSSSSVKDASSSSVEEAEPCTFAATDNAWAVSYRGNDGNNSASIRTVFEIQGEDLVIRDSIRFTGQTANIYCRLMSMNDSTATHPKSMDGKLAGEQTCEGGSAAVLVSTRTEKGYFASNAREAVHASVQKACQAAVNGTAFEVFPLQTKSSCNFTIDDPEWTYSFLDESWNSSDSAIVKYVVAYDDEEECFMSRKYEIHPMPYLECLSKNFSDIGMTKFCSMEGFINASSSGNSRTKEEVFAIEQNYCKQNVPAVVEPESSSSAEIEETSSSSAAAPSGDMVSCDIPGVFGECVEYPAGSDEANAMIAQCESVLEGTLGTGCN